MKKRYQIDREKAVRRFQQEAAEGDRELQLHLPLKQVAADLQEGVGELMRLAGLELMQLVMEDEVRQLAGERCSRRQDDEAYRWGSEQGFLVVDGQKVKVRRPRVRSPRAQTEAARRSSHGRVKYWFRSVAAFNGIPDILRGP